MQKNQDTSKQTAQEILNMINEIYFSEQYKKFRLDNGSNGQRDLIIKKIKETYGIE